MHSDSRLTGPGGRVDDNKLTWCATARARNTVRPPSRWHRVAGETAHPTAAERTRRLKPTFTFTFTPEAYGSNGFTPS
jgi:hypothetical protein